jgi:hypothetical protein
MILRRYITVFTNGAAMKGARTMPQVNIRMPAELKAWLEVQAKENSRSLNAEINVRLFSGLKKENAQPVAAGQALVTQ